MIQTELLKFILEKANEVKTEFGCETLYASHIAVAVADFCNEKYTGFSLFEFGRPRFEVERLRYLFSKEIKLANYFRLRCRHNAKDGIVEEAFHMESCEQITALREGEIISADVLFLCALKELHQAYKPNLKTISSDESILNLLQDADRNIYDYVIEKVEEIRSKLKSKAEEAAAIRDWKPAKKFAEPEEALERFFKAIEGQISEKEITLNFLKFFGTANLKLSIHRVGDVYYVNDNGCAIKHLSRRVKDKQKCERALKRVCHPCWIYNRRITGSFAGSFGFFEYLKSLVFVAHADLYYTRADGYLIPKEKGYFYVGTDKADPLDGQVLIKLLKDGMGCSYDENQGLYCWVDAKCSFSSARMFFLIETVEEGTIRISDRKKGKYEGEIFEEFYWDHDDITPYSKFINKMAERFGAEFDGRDVYLTETTENFSKAVFRFFNLAVLISEFGHNIALPKIRGKVR